MPSWFLRPLPDLQRSIHYIRLAVRALPDRDLATELDELAAMAAKQPDELGIETMHEIYRREQERRADPTRAFDTELDVVLSRLERATNDVDRRRVSDIGLELHRLGGVEALRATYSRVLELGDPKRRHVRQKILTNRWSGIAALREAA